MALVLLVRLLLPSQHPKSLLDHATLLWNDPEVSSWYKQNILIFARDDANRSSDRLRDAWRATPKGPLALVHPAFFLAKVKGAHPGFGRWLRMAPKALRHSLGRRFRRQGARDA